MEVITEVASFRINRKISWRFQRCVAQAPLWGGACHLGHCRSCEQVARAWLLLHLPHLRAADAPDRTFSGWSTSSD